MFKVMYVLTHKNFDMIDIKHQLSRKCHCIFYENHIIRICLLSSLNKLKGSSRKFG